MTTTDIPFHAGEREAQRRAGVEREAARLGGGIRSELSPPIARFLATQRLAVAATLDTDGRPWASLLTGGPGFLQAVDGRLLRLAGTPSGEDPIVENLHARPEVGLLVIDLATRQRVRVNGRGVLATDGVWVETDEVYGNCPKYIQSRHLVSSGHAVSRVAVRSTSLDAGARAWVAGADTFFIASVHPERGADASHRGGRPGFVRVLDGRHLAFDDYPGNNMFNTLGNLLAYPRAGLLFVDFAGGGVLQLTGRAHVRFDPRREVTIEIDEVLQREAAVAQRWELARSHAGRPRHPTDDQEEGHGQAHRLR